MSSALWEEGVGEEGSPFPLRACPHVLLPAFHSHNQRARQTQGQLAACALSRDLWSVWIVIFCLDNSKLIVLLWPHKYQSSEPNILWLHFPFCSPLSSISLFTYFSSSYCLYLGLAMSLLNPRQILCFCLWFPCLTWFSRREGWLQKATYSAFMELEAIYLSLKTWLRSHISMKPSPLILPIAESYLP